MFVYRTAPIASLALAMAMVLPGPTSAAQGPWERTESRTECVDFDVTRQPFFGDTHVHTKLSLDAVLNGMTAGPSDAYDFAKGAPLPLTALNPTTSIQLRRSLDFAMVSDHAEQFGELHICLTPGLQGNDSTECENFRNNIGITETFNSPGFIQWALPLIGPPPPFRFPWCADATSSDGNCLLYVPLTWGEIQTAAEAHYDRSSACAFTTFVGYEWTGMTNLSNLHRNVVFRNENVPAIPASYIDTPTPTSLWDALDADCRNAGTGCQTLIIPHNSNIGNGAMFNPEFANGHGSTTPITAAEATRRSLMEPLVEVNQHKGDSECHAMFSPEDELCAFENLDIGGLADTQLLDEADFSNFVRNALRIGLEREETLGANPFQFGMLSSTDTHLATSGATREDDWAGHVGSIDDIPAERISRTGAFGNEASAGGLAVVWAEENSRDALFAAMQRREVYSTSGTRPIVRFFAGRYTADICDAPSLAAEGYAAGVPMGGELGGGRNPNFVVFAQKDPGPAGAPGTPLQRIQIVKGWVDRNGTSHEAVYDVVGDPNNGAGVDLATCTPTGMGFDTLCSVWRDPDFKKTERAFYYARVVENPSCRWSQYTCNGLGVDCSVPATITPGLEPCCDGSIPSTIQERAVTSPIFYRPESLGLKRARIDFGPVGGDDVVTIKVKVLEGTPAFDPATEDVTISLRDAADVYSVAVPAGTLQAKGSTFLLKDPDGAVGGIRVLKIRRKTRSGAMILLLRTIGLDLSHVDRADHAIDLTIEVGSYDGTISRLWRSEGADRLLAR